MRLAADLVVYLKTSDTCNLNCAHCFTSGSKGLKIFFNPTKSIAFFKDLKEQAPHVRSVKFLFHGGEPLLAPIEDLYKFHDEVKNIFERTTFGMQTNLVFPMTQSIRDFLKYALYHDGFGTSWDYDIRFGSTALDENQRKVIAKKHISMWEKNVRTLIGEDKHYLTMIVCITKKLIQEKEPIEIVNYAHELGFKHILFERITSDGHAKENSDIIPSNREQDEWIYKMFSQAIEFKTYDYIGNMLLSEIVEGYLNSNHVGNRCRGCEEKLITINASGSISGCPNTATEKPWGHIAKSFKDNFDSALRLERINCEKLERNPICFTCDAFQYCNSDCYQLAWDEGDTYCPAPKKIWAKLIQEDDRPTYKKLLL